LYGERDYAFGQLMLTLRTSIGLTQASLGDLLGVSRRAVAEWEAGSSYPKAERLKQLITLGVRASAFLAGREAEEIRALWHAARQKGVALRWLSPGAEYRLSWVKDALSSCFGESRNSRQEKAAQNAEIGKPCGQRMVVVPFPVSQVGTR
jgi:transcriptional regulator with XRE-family HTH domain